MKDLFNTFIHDMDMLGGVSGAVVVMIFIYVYCNAKIKLKKDEQEKFL